MPETWDLIESGFSPGAYNQALDEALLELAASDRERRPVLRLYGWKPPALSLGYFQKALGEVDREACRRSGVDVVRRPTGGRAILHHQEVTYSISLPSGHHLIKDTVIETFRILNRALLAGVTRLGVQAGLVGRETARRSQPESGPGPAACFASPSRYEVQAEGRKVLGSAQVRRGKALLQHGSLLLKVDRDLLFSLFHYPSPAQADKARREGEDRMTSLAEVLEREVAFAQAADALAGGVAEVLEANLVPREISADESRLARRLEAEKYSVDSWTWRR